MPELNTVIRFYRLILAALLAGSLIFHSAILWESRREIAAGYGDFIIFYTGAQIVNDGKSKELFKIETQNAYQAKFDVPQLDWPLPFNPKPTLLNKPNAIIRVAPRMKRTMHNNFRIDPHPLPLGED